MSYHHNRDRIGYIVPKKSKVHRCLLCNKPLFSNKRKNVICGKCYELVRRKRKIIERRLRYK